MIRLAAFASGSVADDSAILPTGLGWPWPTHRYVPPPVPTGTETLNGTRAARVISLPIKLAGRATSTNASTSGRTTASGDAHDGSSVVPGFTEAFCWYRVALWTRSVF